MMLPTGSSSSDISINPLHIDSILFSSKRSLSRRAVFSFDLFFSISILFASKIFFLFFIKFSDASKRISFFVFSSNVLTLCDAILAFFPMSNIISLILFSVIKF